MQIITLSFKINLTGNIFIDYFFFKLLVIIGNPFYIKCAYNHRNKMERHNLSYLIFVHIITLKL